MIQAFFIVWYSTIIQKESNRYSTNRFHVRWCGIDVWHNGFLSKFCHTVQGRDQFFQTVFFLRGRVRLNAGKHPGWWGWGQMLHVQFHQLHDLFRRQARGKIRRQRVQTLPRGPRSRVHCNNTKLQSVTKLQSCKVTSARCSVKVEFNRVQQRQKELEAKHQHINTSTLAARMHQHTKYTRETATNPTHKNPSSLPAAMVPCCCSTRGRFNRLYWPSSSRSTF